MLIISLLPYLFYTKFDEDSGIQPLFRMERPKRPARPGFRPLFRMGARPDGNGALNEMNCFFK